MAETEVAPPRYDFYQTAEHVIVAIYIKGLDKIKDSVDIDYNSDEVIITRPAVFGEGRETMRLGSLHASIKAGGCTSRILSTKVELKLAKASPDSWPTLLSQNPTASASIPDLPSTSPPTPNPNPTVSIPDPSSISTTPPLSSDSPASLAPLDNIGPANPTGHIGGPRKIAAQRKNWDKLVEAELDEKEDTSDPNAGGDGALQKMFADIYADADSDTKRAMIKSFTESGGTSLSTDWSSVGKGQVPIRPPDGMEAKKY